MPEFRTPPSVPVPPPAPAVRGIGLRVRLLGLVAGAIVPPTLVAWVIDPSTAGFGSVLAIIGAIVFSCGLAYVVGTTLVRPIEELTDDAHALSAGVAGHRSTIRTTDEIGRLAVALNQMADTIERRNTALADSERRYRFLFDSNPLPMWAWDAETMNVLAVNEAAIDKYGYDRQHFLSLAITDLLDPSEVARFSGARLPFSESRQNAGTWMHRTASGQRIEMEVITTSSRRLGRASWLSVGIDVTARREAERALARSEAQLRQSQKMEAIGTFAGGISHDFNNLLTGMLGYCDLLLTQLPADSVAREDVEEIRSLAVRGTELSRQILSVSRRQVLQPVVLDPNEVVLGMDRLLRRVIGENIVLHTQLQDVETVRADASQLEQVLLNLASNARDAMPEGGELFVDTAPVTAEECEHFRLDPSQAWMVIRVRDTGTGMSDEVRARIFEPFFTTKPRGKGTGLGLALASSMVDQVGGEIRVESTEQVGTTFHLFLPRLSEAAAPRPLTLRVPEQLNGSETVLLVEDEDTVRTVATAALERRGYRVLAAAGGEAALAIARAFNGPIALLVTDVVMPGLNGRQLADRITQLRPGLPVLYVSGYTEDAVLLKGLGSDDRTLLPKPFTSLELARRVRAAIDATVPVA